MTLKTIRFELGHKAGLPENDKRHEHTVLKAEGLSTQKNRPYHIPPPNDQFHGVRHGAFELLKGMTAPADVALLIADIIREQYGTTILSAQTENMDGVGILYVREEIRRNNQPYAQGLFYLPPYAKITSKKSGLHIQGREYQMDPLLILPDSRHQGGFLYVYGDPSNRYVVRNSNVTTTIATQEFAHVQLVNPTKVSQLEELLSLLVR